MQFIDRYAYASRLRAVDPWQKTSLALLVMALCLALDRPTVGLLAAAWMWALASYQARIPLWVFGRLLLAEGIFFLLTTLGVAISVSPTSEGSDWWSWKVGSWWIGSSWASADVAARLVTRALGAAAAMNFLILTTPVVDLLDLMRRLRMPVLLIDLMALVYRFVFALLESLRRIYFAQNSRLGYGSWQRAMGSSGILASMLFVDAYRRGQRLQTALESRGYSGDLKVLPIGYRKDRQLLWLGVAAVASLLLARVVA